MTMTEGTTKTEPTWQDAAAASAENEARAAALAMPPRRFDEVLPCALTDEELRERADELVKVLDTIDDIEAEKKSANDQFKARIQIQESRARELRTAIEGKREDRPVECIESFELRLGVARTTRTDTGEQIRERALRSTELQPSLPLSGDTKQMSLADAAKVAPVDVVDEDDAGAFDEELALEGDDEDGPDASAGITDPEMVLGATETPGAKVIRRGRKAKA